MRKFKDSRSSVCQWAEASTSLGSQLSSKRRCPSGVIYSQMEVSRQRQPAGSFSSHSLHRAVGTFAADVKRVDAFASGHPIPPLYRVLLRWWLGLPLTATSDSDGIRACFPFCAEAMDSYGDHLLCCNKAEFYTRHQAVVHCLTAFLAAAGLRVANEVQVEGRERPADIFVDRWSTADPAAIDVTVTHPLAPSLGLNIRSAKSVAAAKEKQKVAKYAHLIRDKRLNFPAAFTTFGALDLKQRSSSTTLRISNRKECRGQRGLPKITFRLQKPLCLFFHRLFKIFF